MKKRLVSMLLTVALVLALAPAAFALGAFSDVNDAETAQNVEVLRLMGVLEGNGAGAFHPSDPLTRAEFCKMAVVLTGKRSVVTRFGSRTVFPDVRATHWAAGFVNYAASKDAGLIHGMPDGNFAPDRTITYGEAVAILTRMLGYTDKDTGGIWPDGYIALAGEAGMTKGLSIAGNAAITRAQAAKLFVNALSAENEKGEVLANLLGYQVDLKKDAVSLYSVDLAKGKMRTSDNPDGITMAKPMASSILNSVKGWVITNSAGEAVTFLPSSSASTGVAISDAAIIISADGSTAGFDELSGGADNYAIYRNGIPATASALRKNDVAIYSASSNAILACDTRVSVFYENCEPSPTAPNTITVLGGTEFHVLPTAQQSLSKFKPGQNMTILLSADGKVAGAAESGGNAYAYVKGDGKVSLLCGDTLLPLKASPDVSKVLGDVVRITQSGSNGSSSISLSKQVGAVGELEPVNRTLGSHRIAAGALVFKGDNLTSLAALDKTVVPQGRIAFARTNRAGEVDLIVIKDNTGEYYARVTVRTVGDSGDKTQYITADFGPNGKTVEKESYFGVRTGDYVSFRYNNEDNFTYMAPLSKLSNVSASAWIGDSMVNYGDQTYSVSEQVICYNRDGGSWFTDLAAAKAYGGRMDLYVKDGMVQIVEVRA